MKLNNFIKSFKLAFLLYATIFISFVSIVVSLFITLIFSNSLDEQNYNISALPIPKYNTSSDMFKITPLVYELSQSERANFIKKFIKEYVVNRYTVNDSSFIMNRNLGLADLETMAIISNFKLASIKGITQDNNIIWTDTYTQFKNKKDGELEKIESLMKSGTTRSVRIISEPVKKANEDWWSLQVEFIYKTPITYSLAEAEKEKYQIDMLIEAKGISNTPQPGIASSIFNIKVNHLKKTKL